ncbi:MAG: hypothetical protein LQ343_003880 [Gyalolechia ehrenbergii]|nr:MAG: hypothetical protein LQ343_003880 [Gyalolechia ehrenbergii]
MPPTSKATNSMRRVSSNLAKVSTPPSSTRTTKGSKSSRIVCFKLSSKVLARFAPNVPDKSPSPIPPTKQTPDAPGNVAAKEEGPKSIKVKPEAASPPDEATGSSTPQPPSKEPGASTMTKASSPKTGSKRALGAGVDGPKPRARPGPKKKSKLDDTNGDNGGSAVRGGTGNAAPAHKLGPKANQGAINAGLRALDRTGKPCRKWQKNGFRIRTFTGVSWELPSWRTGSKPLDAGDSPDKASLPTSNSHSKDNNSSSHVGSENSFATPNARIKDDLISSPAPAIAAAT